MSRVPILFDVSISLHKMYRLVLLLTALCLVFSSLNDIGVHGSTIDVLATPERKLRAAKRNDKLSRREVKGCLRHDHELHYLDSKQSTHPIISN